MNPVRGIMAMAFITSVSPKVNGWPHIGAETKPPASQEGKRA